ncbi:MAG: archaetidylserine decarboxylase [Schleiferiaceae bacterium]|nr:archaetidylserine decarboxylase [Schleiferiaceae bacterium]
MEIKFINRATNTIETENPPGEALMRFLYQNPIGKRVVLPIAKQKFVSDWYGKSMASSASKKRIAPFVALYRIDMSEAEKAVDDYTTFNEFFYRKLKPGARKIHEGLVSPGDGKILVFENVTDVGDFFVKGEKFTLSSFLQEADLAARYANASMVILRLAPNDYHRYHFPYSGVPSRSEKIDGAYYSVSPISLEENFTKVFSENKRELCRLQTEEKGEILIIPVGATMVGSLNATYQPDTRIEKGDEMGYFAFGGSTVVLLFDSTAFHLDKDLLENTKNNLETAVKMGERIAW